MRQGVDRPAAYITMKAVVTRVSEARILSDGVETANIKTGFLVLAGVETGDDRADALYLAGKICGLRIFENDEGKMGAALEDVSGELAVVSNFTLSADCRKGRRPDFTKAAPPGEAEELYEYFVECCRANGIKVSCGVFGADMKVHSVNDGPVTIIMDTKEMRRGQ